ncbi:MAG: DUF2079 domain-containing protein [Candidatus Sericytochromatia bacterium]|nr:DUF2079 domain-containing protein [Candidatus Tanganyikabacteria bacterium]
MRAVWWLAGLATVLLFAGAATRHALHWSNLWDLGIFDQALWLLSQGREPVVTTIGFHILGDHAAFILYPLALAYRVWPDVHWLFALQAGALALSSLPLAALARQQGLDPRWTTAVCAAGLLYPAVFNVAMYDFHPECFAVPALLWALWAGQAGRHGHLAAAVVIALSTKEVMGLTVAGLGAFLWLRGTRRAGAAVGVAGLAWFGAATLWIIPHFTGHLPGAVGRYDWLLRAPPLVIFERLFGLPTWIYLALLLLPVAVGLRWRAAAYALPALPLLLLNVLSAASEQRDLIHQYTVPIFPFLLAWLVASLALGPPRRLKPAWLLIWSCAAFLALAKWGFFVTLYRSELATRPAERLAVRAAAGEGGVLAPSHLGSHMAHRETIERIARDPAIDLAPYRYVIVNLRRPGWDSDVLTQELLLERLLADPTRVRLFGQDGVYAFARTQLARADANSLTRVEFSHGQAQREGPRHPERRAPHSGRGVGLVTREAYLARLAAHPGLLRADGGNR